MTGCGVGNCASGCCASGVCRTGADSDACGSGGGACSVCAANTACSASKLCEASSAGCQATCAGCCVGNQCSPGNTAGACGVAGSACRTCSAAQVCDQGQCRGTCSAATCAGCCAGTTCVSPTTNAQCGSAGGACTACGGGQVCAAGQCKIDVGGVCTGSSACASALCVTDAASGTQGRCRAPCSGGACPGGFNCVALTSGASACLPAPAANSQWRVAVLSARIRQTNSAGATWDAAGGLPDPRVCLFVGATAAGCTAEASDTLSATYSFVTAATYTHSQLASVTVTVNDVDLTSDDLIENFQNRNIQGQVEATTRLVSLTGTLALEVVLEVRPQ